MRDHAPKLVAGSHLGDFLLRLARPQTWEEVEPASPVPGYPVEIRPELEHPRPPLRQLADMITQSGRERRPLNSKQQIVAAVLVADLGDHLGSSGSSPDGLNDPTQAMSGSENAYILACMWPR